MFTSVAWCCCCRNVVYTGVVTITKFSNLLQGCTFVFLYFRVRHISFGQHWPQCCFHSGRFRAIPGRLLSVPTCSTVSHKRVLFIYCECSGPSRTRIQDTVVYKHSRHSCFLSTILDNNTFSIDDHYRSKVDLDATSRNVPSS
jgi:hypothetical protein